MIDFTVISHDTPENLKKGLESCLKNSAQDHHIQLYETLLKEQFNELIISLYRKTETQVVILMDEYDKPIIDHLGKGNEALEIAKKNQEIMKSFFGVLKVLQVAPCLRFVLLTGVFKFSRVSVFSELNNLKDLTMLEDYADMLGYTQEELETCFKPYSIFASVSYTLSAQKDEAYFHSLFYLMVSASGADCESEVLTNKGRIDMVIKFSDKIFIIEFKCNQNADAAIKQIHKKGYAAPYKQSGKKIILIGINFDLEKRNIGDWKVV